MKKLTVFLTVALSVFLVGSALAGERYEVAPKYPSFNLSKHHRQNDAWAPGSWVNPYQIKDLDTGKTWTVRPKYPSFTNDDWQKGGTYWNPLTIESED